MEKRQVEAIVAMREDALQQETENLEYAHERMYLNASEYYQRLRELEDKRLEERKLQLATELVMDMQRLEERAAAVAPGPDQPKQQAEIFRQMEILRETYYKNDKKLAIEHSAAIRKINMDAARNINVLYEEQGIGGVFNRAMEDWINSARNAGQQIYDIFSEMFRGLGDAFADLVVAAFEGDMKWVRAQ